MTDIETKKTTKFLRCLLTEEQKRQIATQMAESLQQISQLEANLKSATTQIKAEITRHETTLLGASEKYRSGSEMRNVECMIEKNYRIGRIEVIRGDTYEILEERGMDGEERQRHLFEASKEAPAEDKGEPVPGQPATPSSPESPAEV